MEGRGEGAFWGGYCLGVRGGLAGVCRGAKGGGDEENVFDGRCSRHLITSEEIWGVATGLCTRGGVG